MGQIKTYSQFLNEEMTSDELSIFSRKLQIENWLWLHDVGNFKINDDLTVDVTGNVDLNNKGLTKIPFQFGKVTGDFECSSLYSLKGSPRWVGGRFQGYTNSHNLRYSPKYVGGDFAVTYNKGLTSLEGAPLERGGVFWCNRTNITSLVFMPNLNRVFTPSKENYRIWDTPCEEIYDRLGFTTKAHVEALMKLDPNPADTLRRLKKVYPGRYKEIMDNKEMRIFLGLESEELTRTYKQVSDIEKGYF